MAESFVSLATLVRAALGVPLAHAAASDSAAGDSALLTEPRSITPEAERESLGAARPFAHADVVHELMLLRLAAIDAFERSVPRLLEALAHDVLARELLLASADIDALVAAALAAFAAYEPLRIAVAPCEVQRVRAALPVSEDAALGAGDLAVYVRDGAFESHFTLRLEDALERAAAGA